MDQIHNPKGCSVQIIARTQFEDLNGNQEVKEKTPSSFVEIADKSRLPKLKVPKLYFWCTLLVSVGAFIFGYDTGSIGPITVMPQFIDSFSHISPSIQGLIVSSILITASVASLSAGVLADFISRTYTISLGAGVFAVGSAISCASPSLAVLFVGRIIGGVGEGLFLSAVTVYVCEISPAAIRGRLACITQLFVCIGVAVGFFVCYGTVRLTGSIAWRFPFGMQAVLSFVLCITVCLLPHSPRWLNYVGREEEANHVWSLLGFSADEKELEVSEMNVRRSENLDVDENSRQSISSASQKVGLLGTIKQLLAEDVKSRTLLGWFLMGMQQACGIDGVLYYAPILFSQAGLHENTASFLASAVSGVLLVICTIITQFFIEKWGRRNTMILGGSMIASTMLTLGIIYATHAAETTAGKWAAIVLIYAFVVSFAMSWAVTTRIYSSEIQPMHTRAVASSIGQCINWIVNWIVAFSTPLFLSRTSSGPYFLFGGCAFITVIVCIAFQPETKGANLEELDALFKVSPWERILRRKQENTIKR